TSRGGFAMVVKHSSCMAAFPGLRRSRRAGRSTTWSAMTIAHQPSLFDEQAALRLPPGFAYRPEFLSGEEEARLAAWLGALPFEPFQFRGFEGRRRVLSFGW